MKKRWETPELLSLNGKDVKTGDVTTILVFNEGDHIYRSTHILT